MEPAAFDYVDGGAWDEVTLAENDAAWLRYGSGRASWSTSRASTPTTTLLGAPAAFPVAIAPMAVHGLASPEAEPATARAAARAGVPFTLSTMSTRSIEDVAEAAPDGVRWFQLYTQADPGRSRALVERAAAAGYSAIVLTVDLPVLGYRQRDRLSAFDLGAVEMGNFDAEGIAPTHKDPAPILTWDDLATIRSWSSLPLVLKGILTAEDARLAVEHGVDAIVVSNHGARQLDRVAGPGRRARGGRRRRSEGRCGGLGRRRRPARPRHRDRAGSRRARRARRPADPVGARCRRPGGRGASPRDPARGVRDHPRAPRGADARVGSARTRRAVGQAPSPSPPAHQPHGGWREVCRQVDTSRDAPNRRSPNVSRTRNSEDFA